MLAPVPPAIVSCAGQDGKPNLITVAWTGILSTVPPRTYISVRPSRHSHKLIEESGEFVINLCTAPLARAADFCGMYTGAKVDKLARLGLHAIESEEVACPSLAESPLSLECRVFDVMHLGSHDMFLADIVAVTVDDALIAENGKLRLDRADLCAYAHGEYFALGKRLGAFGFSAVKKKKKR
jgi:flavin reductase (DIM6/NTAB) family NADH-FMN oxidoreductase RutF